MKGEVIEILELEDNDIVKIAFEKDFIEIEKESIPEVHLGDRIQIDGSLIINEIKTEYNSNRNQIK